MKTNLKNKDSFTRSLDVTVSWADLEKDYMKEFNVQKKKFNWYDNQKFFRQKKIYSWNDVMEQIVSKLKNYKF